VVLREVNRELRRVCRFCAQDRGGFRNRIGWNPNQVFGFCGFFLYDDTSNPDGGQITKIISGAVLLSGGLG